MTALCKRQVEIWNAEEYATSEDFCKLFTEDQAPLYLLSLLLTANHRKAERCLVGGLEDSVNANSVFKQWARTWAKRTIVQNAMRIVAPHPNRASATSTGIHLVADGPPERTPDQHAAIASVLALRDFDRFVFVMSVLERYTDQECALLLDCSQQNVGEARMRALQQIAQYDHGRTGELNSLSQSLGR